MLAGVFPLITDAMFHRMTFSGASSFLGAVAALLTVVPWVLVFFGTRIRARSNFAKVFTPILPLNFSDMSSFNGTGNYDNMKDLMDLGGNFVGRYKRLIDYTRIIYYRRQFDRSPV